MKLMVKGGKNTAIIFNDHTNHIIAKRTQRVSSTCFKMRLAASTRRLDRALSILLLTVPMFCCN